MAPPPPAKPAKPEKTDFHNGDYVVYPTHGVGKIVSIEKQSIAGIDLDLIVIRFEKEKMTLRVPIAPVAHTGVARLGARVRPGWFAQTHEHRGDDDVGEAA